MLDEEQKVEIGYVPDNGDESGSQDDAEREPADETRMTLGKKLSVKKIQHEYEKAQKELSDLKAERDELKDKYLRTLADFDNFRKRMKRDKDEYQQYHLTEFLIELLPVYDNLERALKVQKTETPDQSIISGVEMIFKLLVGTFKRFGVEEIVTKRVPFDPTLHQALSKSEEEGVTEAVVSEVYQKGFFYNGKLLRPALVRVALPMEPPKEAMAADSKEE